MKADRAAFQDIHDIRRCDNRWMITGTNDDDRSCRARCEVGTVRAAIPGLAIVAPGSNEGDRPYRFDPRDLDGRDGHGGSAHWLHSDHPAERHGLGSLIAG